MSEPESFLARWARLKREAEAPREGAPPDAAEESGAPADASTPSTDEANLNADAAPGIPAPGVDLSALPPIESITATTDIRGFLAPGVPPELARAALRRAWVADPKIRDFIGIAENQWDFTADNAVPGFGPLSPLDDVRRLVAQVIGERDEPKGEPDASATVLPSESPQEVVNSDVSGAARVEKTAGTQPSAHLKSDEQPAATESEIKTVNIAAQQELPNPAPVKRSHGRALPK